MTSALRERIRASRLLGTTNFGQLFDNVTNATRDELVTELQIILQQKITDGENGKYRLSDAVVRYIALELVKIAVVPQRGQKRGREDEPDSLNPASALIRDFANNDGFQKANRRYLNQEWVDTVRQSEGMQRQFDNVLLGLVGIGTDDNPAMIGRIERDFRKDGLKFYNQIASAITTSTYPKELPLVVLDAKRIVLAAFNDFQDGHGYISLMHILTYYRINEVFRLAVLDTCKTIASVGFGDGDEAVVGSLPSDHVSDLGNAMSHVTSLHIMTKSPPRLLGGLMENAKSVYFYDDNTIPVEEFNVEETEFFYWVMNMTLTGVLPRVQAEYFAALNRTYPNNFGVGKGKQTVNVQFIYFDFVGNPEDLRGFEDVSRIRNWTLTFLINTTRGYVKALKPTFINKKRNPALASVVSKVSEEFYASANFSDLLTDTYGFYRPDSYFYGDEEPSDNGDDDEESSSSLSSSDEEEEEEEDAEPDLMDVSHPITMSDAFSQLALLLTHLGLPVVSRLQTMSRAGLIIFIRNLLASPDPNSEFPYVTRQALVKLANDLNANYETVPPFKQLAELELEQANAVRDDNERLAFYTNMTLDDINRIYERYSSLRWTGHTAPAPTMVDTTNPTSFLQSDMEPIFEQDDPLDLDSLAFDHNPFSDPMEDVTTTPERVRSEAELRAEQEALEDAERQYTETVAAVKLDIRATVYEMIKRNASYTHQGYPDLLRLLRISRLSPLFFQVAVESYIPTVTSLVIRGNNGDDGTQLDQLEAEIQKLSDSDWSAFSQAFSGLFRIMSLYKDPIFADAATYSRLKPLLMQVLEFRAVRYTRGTVPRTVALFLDPNRTAKLRMLVLQYRVTTTIPRLWTQENDNFRERYSREISSPMRALMKQLSVIIEQPAVSPLTRGTDARDRYWGSRSAYDAERGRKLTKFERDLEDTVINLGGLLQFRPGNQEPVIVWPFTWPDGVNDIEAEKRARARRTMTDVAVLHELLNRPIEKMTSPLDREAMHVQAQIEYAIQQRDRFQEIVTLQNYREYKYPADRSELSMPVEFGTRDDFRQFETYYLGVDSVLRDQLTEISPGNRAYYNELVRSAELMNTTVNEIIYACFMLYIGRDLAIRTAQTGNTFPFEQLADLAIDTGIMGWATRNMLALRIPSLMIGKDISSHPLIDIRNRVLSETIAGYLVNVTEVIVESRIEHPLLQRLSRNANTVSLPSTALPIADFSRAFSPSTLRHLKVRLGLNLTQDEAERAINDIALLFTPDPVPDLNRESALSLVDYAAPLSCLTFNVTIDKIRLSRLDARILTLPFLVRIRDAPIANEQQWQPIFDSFQSGQTQFIRDVYTGRLGFDFTYIVPRDFVPGVQAQATTSPTVQMQGNSRAALSLQSAHTAALPTMHSFSVDLRKIKARLVGSDREYAPILYTWTSWGNGRRPIRIAATDDDATTLTKNWTLSLPAVSESTIRGDDRIHFSLYARSRESGLDSINQEEAAVIDRIIPIGRTSVSLRQLLVDSVSRANRASRILRFEEPTLNERLETMMIQNIGIKVTEDQRNSIRDKVMRENAGGSFRISLALSMHQLGVVAPRLISRMEADVVKRFELYTAEDNNRVVPPFEDALLEPLYVRAMYPLYLNYSKWFIGNDQTPPIVPPSTEVAASLHLFLWQTPIGALLPARAFWQCIPQLIPYTSEGDRARDIALFEDSSLSYKEMYFQDLLQISLDVDDISPEMFVDVVNRQLSDTSGNRVHEWFMTCAAACVRIGMLAANALHYTSDFRFDRSGKQYEDEYWNVDASSGFSNAADCENSEQLLSTPILRSIVMDKEKWKGPLMKTAARVLDLYVIKDIGAVVTAAYVGPSDPARTGDLPVIGSAGDRQSSTGGHCHGLLTPKGVAADQSRNGGASKRQAQDAFGSLRYPPWHYRLHKMVVEGTGAIFPYILPLRETFAEQPNEYAFHRKKKELSKRVTQRLNFPASLGFGAYRYPFYDDTPSENRRVSPFYRLLCHGVLAIEALRAPELGKLTFAKRVGSNRYAWGVDIGEYLRDGRSGPGSSKFALISSCLHMRDHFTRYVNPYIESVTRQLPLASVGRAPISTWNELSTPRTNTSIRTSLACVLCPRCDPGSANAPKWRKTKAKKVVASHQDRELLHTAQTRSRIKSEALITPEKVKFMKRLATAALDEGDVGGLSNYFSLTTLRRYAISDQDLERVFLRGGVWETIARRLLGKDHYRDTVLMRSKYSEYLGGTPMYFIIIATEIMKRRRVLPKGRFSPSVCVVTDAMGTRTVDVPDDPYSLQAIAMLSVMLSDRAVEVCTELLPLIGGPIRYFESLQSVRTLLTEENRTQFSEVIQSKWDAHLPNRFEKAAPTMEELNALSLEDLATLWIDVYSSEQWHNRVQIMLENLYATPRGIMEMTYEEVEAFEIPEEGAVFDIIYSPKDDPRPFIELSDEQRRLVASCMLLDDAYEACLRLQSIVDQDTGSLVRAAQEDYLAFATTGYSPEIREDDIRSLVSTSSLRFAYYGAISTAFSDVLKPIVVGNDDVFNYTTRTSNWGFYRVDIEIVPTDTPSMFDVIENSKPENNPEVQMQTIMFVDASTPPFIINSLIIDDTIGPTAVFVNFDETPTQPARGIVVPIGNQSKALSAPPTPKPNPAKLSFFAYGWLLESPEYMVPFRKRIDEISGNDSTFDVFTPLPSTGDMSLRIVIEPSADRL